MTDEELLTLLHSWTVVGEYDAGYIVGRCTICGTEDLLDTWATAG